ncbi:hypothetical protein L596_000774 [Steinernema carpocapsae]|uniref:Uncharacterized protein n=1 Tax=Steinernema carpocapsae TaxID=34508 RepID=A0A4U8UJ38_STECR|nr:hypothetical protein L596_000774 [Steinernema carpocapsae]
MSSSTRVAHIGTYENKRNEQRHSEERGAKGRCPSVRVGLVGVGVDECSVTAKVDLTNIYTSSCRPNCLPFVRLILLFLFTDIGCSSFGRSQHHPMCFI